jgi:LmbE family N-acetylglucosaminyl deacetylase
MPPHYKGVRGRMITPICGRTEWIASWAQLPSWKPPNHRLIVISPHPDDETLAIGGFIASRRALGIEVLLIAVTDGENAYGLDESLRVVRQTEQNRAAAHLGIPEEGIVRLHFPDSGVEPFERELVARIAALVSPSTLLLAPWSNDFHPDHKVCGRAAERVAAETGIALASYFFWTWHTEDVRTVAHLPLSRFELKAAWLARKTAALAEHKSQLIQERKLPILPPDLLWPARARSEVFLLS